MARRRCRGRCSAVVRRRGRAVVFGGYPPPCHDDLAFEGPRVDITATYDETTGSVLVRHRGGDTLSAESTDALYVEIVADGSEERARYPAAKAAADFPVASGDQLRVRNVTVSGRRLAEGDTIWVVRRGSQRPLPVYCPNSRSESTLNHAVGKHVVQ